MDISFVIPVFNEEGNVTQLHTEIINTVTPLSKSYEIIFVNDGSTDNTLSALQKLRPIKIINFRKNFQQTAALDAGLRIAQGNIVITMDGDLQNNPSDIPAMLNKIEEGFDVVTGWRWQRNDPVSKKIISRVANFLRHFLIDDHIHDSGCGFKAIRKECLANLDLYGEMHRFIPGLLLWQGFKITEIKIDHRPRTNGVTKYTASRILKGFLDMGSVWFWRKFSTRPLHIFGSLGLTIGTAGSGLLLFLLFIQIFNINWPHTSTWPMVGFFMVFTGIQLIVSGLLADVALKNYYRANKSKPYSIKNIINNE
ncbi:glycosyltransferase [archaeon]|nr:glycosyltransferase [archaeon]